MLNSELLEDKSLLRRRRTKIVCTLGPASSDPEIIRRMIADGMNCARINGSHGDHDAHRRTIQLVRELAAEVGRPVAILFDLQGPKIRTSADSPSLPRTLQKDERIQLVVRRKPTGDEIGIDYDGLDGDVDPGQPLLFDDGSIATEVESVANGVITCRVENDGTLEKRKGINLPLSAVSLPALTDKDCEDVQFAVAEKVDLIALSFVRRSSDVVQLQDMISELGETIPVVAKIEKRQALEDLPGIITTSWGVMVARGDLGVELPLEAVPSMQKRIIEEANARGRPVITATQMLDSMTRNPRPTRAETSDVANAVLDGTDAVMLSQETAVGKYPIQSVRTMVRILRATELSQDENPEIKRRVERGKLSIHEAVADSAVQTAAAIDAHAIVAFSQLGNSALLTAQRRPGRQIVVFTTDERLRNLFAVVWGIRSYKIDPVNSTDELFKQLDNEMLQDDLAQKGDQLVLLMGAPTHRLGPPNLLLVHRVGEWMSLE